MKDLSPNVQFDAVAVGKVGMFNGNSSNRHHIPLSFYANSLLSNVLDHQVAACFLANLTLNDCMYTWYIYAFFSNLKEDKYSLPFNYLILIYESGRNLRSSQPRIGSRTGVSMPPQAIPSCPLCLNIVGTFTVRVFTNLVIQPLNDLTLPS